MDSNSSFIWNPSPYNHHHHHQNNEDQDGFIDLGLSLKTLEPSEEDEGEGAQSKERWAYVKVNMDGVMVGRKICLMPHNGGYQNLAQELEDMFGTQSESGLRLFQPGSQFSLFYMDRDKNWRTVGDVPWEEFIGFVKRLRITRNSC